MKKLKDFFTRQSALKLENCTSFQIEKEESDKLYGGFKEYKPPIYEQEGQGNTTFKTTELFIHITDTK
ncbi:hypothetical protein [Filimonas lacunae]|nr:hypothetical protein [Filimonas lacunae]